MEAKAQLSRRKQRILIIELLYQKEMGMHPELPDIPFVKEAMTTIETTQEAIDQTIEDALVGYTLKRLSMVDRAILRLAVFELRNTQTPSEIILDEALHLTHIYTDLGDKKAVAFNNKVLDSILKRLQPSA